MERSIEIFFCYAREDEALRQELEKQLRALRRQGIINLWHDRKISPGTQWEHEIDQHLKTARIVLLLISSDFIDSDYCYGIEMKQSMERHERGESRVIPIILRPVYWQKAPFGKLQALPTDARPVTSSKWHTQDEAFFDVAEGIRVAVEELIARDEAEQWKNQGDILYRQKNYSKALDACEQALHHDSNFVPAYNSKGNILHSLKRYKEAIAMFEQALHLDPDYAPAYNGKGNALYFLKRYEEALAAYEQALRLDPDNANAYTNKGNALHDLKRYKEALVAYEQALRLDPDNANAYNGKGLIFDQLKRPVEAEQAFAKAKQLGYPP